MLLQLLFLATPMILAATTHMVIVKKNVFPFLVIPINQKIFGANKTWRGVIVMPVLGFVSMLITLRLLNFFELSSLLENLISPYLLGFILGLAYILGELPNSFIKRKMKIPAGGQAEKYRWFFMILDRIDSATAISLVYYLWGVPALYAFLLIPFNLLLHPTITIPLYFLGIKKKLF